MDMSLDETMMNHIILDVIFVRNICAKCNGLMLPLA